MPKLVAMYSTLVIQANMLDVTRRSSHKWYARNGSHKLTACYKVYSAYKVRRKKLFKKNQVATCYCCERLPCILYHKWYAKNGSHILTAHF